MIKGRLKLKTSCFTLFLVLICVFFEESFIINNGWILYLVQLLYFIKVIFAQKNNNVLVFSPSFITLFYLGINFTLGHYVVSNNIGLEIKYFDAFNSYQSVSFISAYFLLCNQIVFLGLPLKKYAKLPRASTSTKKEKDLSFKDKIYLIILFGLLIISSFVTLDLSFIGGRGDFSYAIKLSLVIFIVFKIFNLHTKIKYLLYVTLSLIFVVTNYDSKREFFYVLILIFFVEFIMNNINFNLSLKKVVLYFFGFLFVIYIVVIASIMRGYGNYDVDNPLEASKYTIEYLESDFAQSALVSNFELNTVYGNGSNAVNYIYSDKEQITYGSTFLKFLFLPVPRSVFPDKPQSMIDIYTSKFDPNFRSEGGSLPVILYSEAFWNFSLFAFLFIFVFYQLINTLYLKMVTAIKSNVVSIYLVFVLYLYITIIQFIRGSGFELWLIYPLVSLPVIFLVVKFTKQRK